MKTLSENASARPEYSAKVPDRHQFDLADVLNRYFQVGCKTFTRHELLAYSGVNQTHVENCLHYWASKGLVQIFKPLAEAKDGEIVVKLLQPIENPRLQNKPIFLIPSVIINP
jgi:hypothetical protein